MSVRNSSIFASFEAASAKRLETERRTKVARVRMRIAVQESSIFARTGGLLLACFWRQSDSLSNEMFWICARLRSKLLQPAEYVVRGVYIPFGIYRELMQLAESARFGSACIP